MYGTNTELKSQPLLNVKVGEKYRYEISFFLTLGVGTYSIQTALVSSETHFINNYEWRDLALIFQVINSNHPHFEGSTFLDPVIEIESI